MLEGWFALGDKRRHAFLLIIGRKQRVKDLALMRHAVGQLSARAALAGST
jgi:hypothetical protein